MAVSSAGSLLGSDVLAFAYRLAIAWLNIHSPIVDLPCHVSVDWLKIKRHPIMLLQLPHGP